jgi:Skp family chaperone for outer membrane proteins
MKNTIIALTILASLSAAADLKIGTVNMIHLVELHPTHESNKTLVKSSNDDFKAKLDEKQDALKAMLDDARKTYDDMQNPMLSASAKADAQKKLDGMQQKINAARQDLIRSEQNYRETMNDLETRLLKMETSDIRAKISVYAKEKGLDLVIDSSMAAYANDSLDVTDDILKAMNVDPAKRTALKDKGKEKNVEGK